MSLILFSFLFSCGDSNESSTKVNKTETNFANRVSDEELLTFKNDSLIPLFVEKYHGFLLSMKVKDVNGIITNNIEGNEYLNQLYLKYGEENVKKYIEELALSEYNSPTDPFLRTYISLDNSVDGSSCTREANGTTYWGNCSFWEGAQAYLAILANCGVISAGDSMQVIEEYYICNQKQICKYC